MLRDIADKETNRKQRFKIVEKGGVTIERSLMKPNPIGGDGCKKDDCPICKQPGGGKLCHKCNVCYRIKCLMYENENENAVYFGKTNRNLYTRGKEHESKMIKKDENSFMHKHQMEKHNGAPAQFEMKVLKSCKDPLTRQVTEAVLIKNHRGDLLNSKSEFYQPPLVRIRSEIIRGLDD